MEEGHDPHRVVAPTKKKKKKKTKYEMWQGTSSFPIL
jgi:hypothetical protein